MKKAFYILVMILLVKTLHAQDVDYKTVVNQWHKARIEGLKKPNGWLNLEGLFWLHKGNNSFGSTKTADCYYNNPSFPSLLGNFNYEGDSVTWTSAGANLIDIDKIKSNPNQSYTVFKTSGKASVMDWNQFSWVVIKREDKVGIRFRNLKAKTLLAFKGIDRFPINAAWKIQGKLEQPVQDILMITNVLGQNTETKNAGKFVFEKNGQKYSLDVIDEGGEKLFIVFADQTSGVSTYGAGRFIEIPKPDVNGNTEIDFNYAYNPPCAFTAFATCPLPPKQNRLALKIEAGEKNYGHH
ncbi:MAG: hypothetical protein RI940_843 [Bacteroidota bacterium]|jgi:uncharacterized protein (DUF1684 family)